MTDQADTPDPIGEAELRDRVRLMMAMVDSGKVRIEPTDPDDGVGVAWIRIMDAASTAATELAAARDREAAVRADTYRDAADEIRREARWQTELKKRGMPDDVGGFMHRLLMLDRLLRDRAALSQSEPTKETDHA